VLVLRPAILRHVSVGDRRRQPRGVRELPAEDGRMTQHTLDVVRELRGTRCHCGSQKRAGHSFCMNCYQALPYRERDALYHRLDRGYVEAYNEAVKFLDNRVVA
jgi:hypothetical protein